jgi:hypothetical protein
MHINVRKQPINSIMTALAVVKEVWPEFDEIIVIKMPVFA